MAEIVEHGCTDYELHLFMRAARIDECDEPVSDGDGLGMQLDADGRATWLDSNKYYWALAEMIGAAGLPPAPRACRQWTVPRR